MHCTVGHAARSLTVLHMWTRVIVRRCHLPSVLVLDWTGLVLDWTGLDWTGLARLKLRQPTAATRTVSPVEELGFGVGNRLGRLVDVLPRARKCAPLRVQSSAHRTVEYYEYQRLWLLQTPTDCLMGSADHFSRVAAHAWDQLAPK